MKSKILTSFLGIRNKEGPRSIPFNALVDCENLDISSEGVLLQRAGHILAKTIPVSAAYSTLAKRSYIITDGILCEVLADLSLLELAATDATAFDDYKQFLFLNTGLMVNDDTVTNLKLPIPAFAPQLTVLPGDLPAGTYRSVSTYKAASGLESGASPMSVIELTGPGNISIQNEIEPAGYQIINYLSYASGTVFYRPDGVQIDPVQLTAKSMPDGELIAYHDSRLWLSRSLADGSSVVWFSKLFSMHWWNLEKDFIIIPGQVLMLASTSKGLVIGTHKAIYAYVDDTLQPLADYGVIKGKPYAKTPEHSVLMWTERGVCSYPPFTNHTVNKATFPPGSQCSAAIVESNGISRFVALNDGIGVPYNARS